jgi:hypothetical protein
MALDVVVYRQPTFGRSIAVCEAMAEGISRCGDRVTRLTESQYRCPEFDVAVFYGLAGRLERVFKDYPRAGKPAVYIDLGYWGRLDGGKRAGFHKFSVNSRHPTAYFQNRRHPSDRAKRFNLRLRPWQRNGRHILIAGMGPKACAVEGLHPLVWETRAVRMLRQVTQRPIIYRPKPSWDGARPIAGVGFSDPKVETDVCAVLKGCWAVVTHHSNVAVDGLLAGVPAFCAQGVAVPMGLSDVSLIEAPLYPDNRARWVNDVAYTQFNVAEMREGLPWRHLKDEGLIP